MNLTEGINVDLELNVNISVLPYIGCYIPLLESYDDRHDMMNMYELNDLNTGDHRLIRIRMYNNECSNIGEDGLTVDINDRVKRKLMGDKCNYIPYQLIKDCKDGDTIDYILTLPYQIHILLHVTCNQIPVDESEFTHKDIAALFTKFESAVDKCKSERLKL